MSFFDDLLEFGGGALDSVGENADWLFGEDGNSSNPNTTQQPNAPVVDNNGNAVTTPQGSLVAKDNTLLYIGGGIAALLVLVLLVVMLKGK
ncbi:hypothetical protein [Vibrio splendidus]|uniref:hypothetical protein n=1 Tax=Vibrio splendidus TaxID=29497 RepID=UPI000D39B5FE|nr:hypothetical protein [Vibrio splendidus]PTO84115.1 hypothetical protein CWO29_21380 [Vibrio splendidus]